MTNLYLLIFIAINIAIIVWSLAKIERIYQFPFFMASVFLSFILPQAIAIVKYSGISVTDTAVERMLIYTSLCVAMCWIGYQTSPNPKWLKKIEINIDKKKLFKSGLVLLVIGWGCTLALSQITIQTTAAGTWTGPATILGFFSGVLRIALPLFLIRTLKRPSAVNLILTIISGFPTVQAIILAGRRQPTVAFLVTVGLCFFLVKKYIPPRLLLISLVPIAAYIIPTLGNIRGEFWELLFAGQWGQIQLLSQEGLNKVIEGNILELRNATLVMDYASQLNQYGYGTQLWNAIIFQYVPGQILGYEFKQSLQFDLTFDLESFYGYTISTGTTLTGMGDSFIDFGFFGCLFFALMAIIFKTLWISTMKGKSMTSTLLYVSLIDSAMVGITHGIGRFACEFIFKSGVIFLINLYCKSPKQQEIFLFSTYK